MDDVPEAVLDAFAVERRVEVDRLQRVGMDHETDARRFEPVQLDRYAFGIARDRRHATAEQQGVSRELFAKFGAAGPAVHTAVEQ